LFLLTEVVTINRLTKLLTPKKLDPRGIDNAILLKIEGGLLTQDNTILLKIEGGLLTQIEKTPEHLFHPYTVALLLT
jgi:hypothetical protein